MGKKIREIWIQFVGSCAAFVGCFLSVLLILEYHGTNASFAEAICKIGRGVNSCTIVAASRFAAVKGIPLIGDIPVAVFGLVFYGFVLFLFLYGLRKNDRQAWGNNSALLILIISFAALLCDAGLYYVSVFIIKAVCPLCMLTYASTLLVLMLSVLLFMRSRRPAGETPGMSMPAYIKKHFLLFELTALVLFAAGMGISFSSRAVLAAKDSFTYEERLGLAVRRFEAAKPVAVDISNAAFIGKRDAAINLVVYFDFTCSHCWGEIKIVEDLAKKYKDAIRVSFKDLPLDGDCADIARGREDSETESCYAAAAAFCANLQGKYMPYTKILLRNYHEKGIHYTVKSLRDAASKTGLRMRDFDVCLSSKAAVDFIEAEVEESERIGIWSTPTLYLNGRLLKGQSRKGDILEGLVRYCMERDKQ